MRIHNQEKINKFYKKDKLNIAMATDIYSPSIGGIENVVSNLCKSFHQNKDVNIVCITGDVKNYKDKEDFAIIRTKSIKIPKKWGLFQPVPELDTKFKKTLKNLNIDVFHIHTVYGVSNYVLKYAKKHNIPVIFQGHSKFSEEIPTCVKSKIISNIAIKRAYKILNKTDLVLPVSEHTKQNYLANGVKTPMIVIPNATNLKLVENKNNEIEKYFEEKYNISASENVLLFVGRLEMKCKNLDFLLRSLKILKEKNFDFKLLIVGSGNDEQKLKDLTKELNLDANVVFVGKITDQTLLSKFYYFSDLFCFPSIVDNCPVVKLEAASQKTPTLAISNSASAEGITDGFNGYCCELEENKFADKIIQIFGDKNKLKEISFNAYETLNVGWDKVTNDLLKLYKQLIDKKTQDNIKK